MSEADLVAVRKRCEILRADRLSSDWMRKFADDGERLADEVERLREALGFYENLNNYNTDGAPGHHGPERKYEQFGCDLGEIARAALHTEVDDAEG